MFPALDPTSQGVIWYQQSICIDTVSLLMEDSKGVVPVGQIANKVDFIFTQAYYIELQCTRQKVFICCLPCN